MTDDLLVKIFYHLCEPGPLPLRHLLFVSRRFYSATVNSGHLWTTISFDSLFARHFRQLPEQANIFVEQCLLRSGSLPLRLYIVDYDLISYASTHLHQKPEWRALQRCTSMIWVSGGNMTTIAKIVALLPKSLPSLQYISLSRFSDPIDGSQFPNCPVLERVEMLDHGKPSPLFWGTNFLHVTTLSLGNTDTEAWMNYNMTTLSQFPVLLDLTLFTEYYRAILIDGDPQPPINFNRLQILRARGRIPPWIVFASMCSSFRAAQHLTSIYGLSHLLEPHCQHIYALLPKAVSEKEPGWATDLFHLLRKCTRIKSLHISKWMEKGCEKKLSRRNSVVLHVQ